MLIGPAIAAGNLHSLIEPAGGERDTVRDEARG